MLRQPSHEHACMICRGVFPCWENLCDSAEEFICNDCTEDLTAEPTGRKVSMENNKAPLLLLFDLDDTLIVTSALKILRDSRKWAEVYRSFPMTTLPPGTLEFISKWTNDATLGVVTNSPRTYAERLLKYHGVDYPRFVRLPRYSEHKPHPAPILRAIEKTGMTITDSIYIGDLAEDARRPEWRRVSRLSSYRGLVPPPSLRPVQRSVGPGLRCLAQSGKSFRNEAKGETI